MLLSFMTKKPRFATWYLTYYFKLEENGKRYLIENCKKKNILLSSLIFKLKHCREQLSISLYSQLAIQ